MPASRLSLVVLIVLLACVIGRRGVDRRSGGALAPPCPCPVDVESDDGSVPPERLGLVCREGPADSDASALAESVCGGPVLVNGTLAAGRLLSVSCTRGRGEVLPLPLGERVALGTPLDLNEAGEADLETLPGVGPSLAQRILDARAAQPGGRFAALSDLLAVRGIGPVTLSRLGHTATVGK
jgi:DNA uptake protein ComE-like DNA-binding protein